MGVNWKGGIQTIIRVAGNSVSKTDLLGLGLGLGLAGMTPSRASSVVPFRRRRKKSSILNIAIPAKDQEEEEEEAHADITAKKKKKSLRCSSLPQSGNGRLSRTEEEEEEEEREKPLPFPSLDRPEAIEAALLHIKVADAKLAALVDSHEKPSFQACDNAFLSLSRSIIYQQLATKAAHAIYSRLVALFQGETNITPDAILKLSAAQLRSIGISERKASYLHDLSRHFLDGLLSDTSIHLMNDEELISALTGVKGIGVWSAHMFMIFALHKPDVLPVGDLGIRKGFQKVYNLRSLPTPKQMEDLSASWQPYRTIGSWYMWRAMGTKSPVTSSE